ncbi:hypothetical protein FHW67_000349 [Herbaspirillum sp. Sphag1AN]|uniref:hypothetical protein n=1 Tax=unclassified Herbaspirillum TaxID=2624150 RepID=UPI00161752B9|nr:MULTISPECIES: hypothetical protein [unclassified Herbaspirillum]MBB3211114.1 hypothetical protein [Herbaspirillum sp. Sphag1AN]MBB3244743.1 hypothetical protein [Herbaspirillum sp. Sphag64]
MARADTMDLMLNIFETRASALDAAGNDEGLHEASTRLATWIESTEGKLSQRELIALIHIGAIVFREGVRQWD